MVRKYGSVCTLADGCSLKETDTHPKRLAFLAKPLIFDLFEAI